MEAKAKRNIFDTVSSAHPSRLRAVLNRLCCTNADFFLSISEEPLISQGELKMFTSQCERQGVLKQTGKNLPYANRSEDEEDGHIRK